MTGAAKLKKKLENSMPIKKKPKNPEPQKTQNIRNRACLDLHLNNSKVVKSYITWRLQKKLIRYSNCRLDTEK